MVVTGGMGGGKGGVIGCVLTTSCRRSLQKEFFGCPVDMSPSVKYWQIPVFTIAENLLLIFLCIIWTGIQQPLSIILMSWKANIYTKCFWLSSSGPGASLNLITQMDQSWCYRVFFIESGKVICYKIHKIWLFHDGFGLRTEVKMGHLISDHFKMHF